MVLDPSDFRVTAATSSSPSSALGGSASDIAGTDDTDYSTDDENFIAIIEAADCPIVAFNSSTNPTSCTATDGGRLRWI